MYEITGGLEGGDVIVFGARPGVGKSAFVSQVILSMVRDEQERFETANSELSKLEILISSGQFDHIYPHVFRHTFATRCIEKGMSPQVLKTILGHSKLAMTMDLYSHVLPDTKAEEMQKIAGLF